LIFFFLKSSLQLYRLKKIDWLFFVWFFKIIFGKKNSIRDLQQTRFQHPSVVFWLKSVLGVDHFNLFAASPQYGTKLSPESRAWLLISIACFHNFFNEFINFL